MAPPPSSLRVNGCTKPERLAATMPFRTWFALGLASGLALVTGLGLGLGLGIGLGIGLGLGLGVGLARVIGVRTATAAKKYEYTPTPTAVCRAALTLYPACGHVGGAASYGSSLW